MKQIMKNTIIFFFLFLGLAAVSCNSYESGSGEKPLARVHDKYLYPSDLRGILPTNISRADSAQIARNYVQKWIRTQLMLKKAEVNLTQQELQEIYKQLDETRTSLTIYKYEQQMMFQRMDTAVSEEEIQNFYNEHSDNFILDKNIVKAIFIKIPQGAPNLDRVRGWYRSADENDMNELESYCYQYANKFDYFNDAWIYFDQVVRQLPGEISNQEQFLRYNTYTEAQDSAFHYFVAIRDYMLKGSEAPVAFVEDNIRNIILNKRKLDFTRELEKSVYTDGLTKNEFEIYTQ